MTLTNFSTLTQSRTKWLMYYHLKEPPLIKLDFSQRRKNLHQVFTQFSSESFSGFVQNNSDRFKWFFFKSKSVTWFQTKRIFFGERWKTFASSRSSGKLSGFSGSGQIMDCFICVEIIYLPHFFREIVASCCYRLKKRVGCFTGDFLSTWT